MPRDLFADSPQAAPRDLFTNPPSMDQPTAPPSFLQNIGQQWNNRENQVSSERDTDSPITQWMRSAGSGIGFMGDVSGDIMNAGGKIAYDAAHPIVPQLADLASTVLTDPAKIPYDIGHAIAPQTTDYLASKLASGAGSGGGYIGQKYNEYLPPGSQQRTIADSLGDSALGLLKTLPVANGIEGLVSNAPAIADAAGKIATGPVRVAADRIANPIEATGAVSTSAGDFAEAGKAYNALDNSQTVLTPQGVQKFVEAAKKAANIDPQVQMVFPNSETGKVVQGLQALADSGEPVKIQTLHSLVKQISQSANGHFSQSMDETGRELLNMKDAILHAAQNPKVGDLTGGTDGFNAWQQANKFYTQGSRLEDVEKVIQRAKMTKNRATSLQTGFRNLAMNAKKTRGYSDAQTTALEHAGNTGAIGSVLHVFGNRLIPGAASLIGLGENGITGGLISGGLAHMGTGAMRAGATAVQMQRANALMKALSSGSKFTPTSEQATIAEALSKGAYP